MPELKVESRKEDMIKLKCKMWLNDGEAEEREEEASQWQKEHKTPQQQQIVALCINKKQKQH